MITPLPVPIYSQRDPRWAGQKLGSRTDITLGSHGCCVTSVAMMDSGFDPHNQWNPSQVDEYFTKHGGYANQCLVIWTAITRLLPNSGYQGCDSTPTTPAPIAKIKQHLDNGGLVILDVRYNGRPNAQHFVTGVGYEGDDIIFHDPWYGDRSSFASKRYGTGVASKDIIKTHYFIDTMPEVKPVQVAPPPSSPVAPRPMEVPNEIPEPLVDLRHQWEQTYSDNPEQRTTTVEAYATDMTSAGAPVQVPAGTTVDVAGYFTSGDKRYARTVYAKTNNSWYGLPEEAFAEATGQPSGEVPVEVVEPVIPESPTIPIPVVVAPPKPQLWLLLIRFVGKIFNRRFK